MLGIQSQVLGARFRGDERKRASDVCLFDRRPSHSNALLENPRLASAFTNSVLSSDPVFLRGPQTPRMAAKVAAAPAPNRDGRRRRLVDGKAHVGRDRWARQRNQRGRCEQEFPHHLAPAMKGGAVCNAWTWNTVADAPHPRGFAQRRRAVVGNRDLWRRCRLSCPLPAAVGFGPFMMPNAGKTRVGTAR